MKTTHTAFAMIVVATLLGMAATVITSGCQQKTIELSSNSTSPPPIEDIDGDEQLSDDDQQTEGTGKEADDNTVADNDTKPTTDNGKEATGNSGDGKESTEEPVEQVAIAAVDKKANAVLEKGDWRQWGGSSYRNNVPITGPVVAEWDIGNYDRKKGTWSDSKNVKWVAALGSQTYGNPVVGDGRIFVGTNNSEGYLPRYPDKVDLGCLVCFNEKDGKFLWQHSSEKLPTGRVHDWEMQGICCAPLVEGERLWFVSSRGMVICLDTQGYADDEDDGPVQNQWGRLFNVMSPAREGDENHVEAALAAIGEGNLSEHVRNELSRVEMPVPMEVKLEADKSGRKWTFTAKVADAERNFEIRKAGSPTAPRLEFFKQISSADKNEADTVWEFDMMGPEMGISQHNMCSCSVTSHGDILFVNTSNGVDESHLNIPAPDAPSFIAMDKNTGEVLWTDKSPGLNILHGQWSSPTVAELGGVPQVIFGGGDGWVYSFKADRGTDGKPELLWKFDANPKTSEWVLGGRGTRNNIIATPVIYDGLVYVAVGQDPEHGEGEGHLWCLDPTKRGDVSPSLAMKVEGDKRTPIPPKRLQAVIEADGEVAVDNMNSAVVWHYSVADRDLNDDGRIDFEETMHRSCGTVAIKDDILYIADFSGLFHCLNAKTGRAYWTYDMFAAAWGSPLIADGKVYIGDEDGDVAIFNLSTMESEPFAEFNMDGAVYSTPIVANGVLYIASNRFLFAIEEPGEAAGQ